MQVSSLLPLGALFVMPLVTPGAPEIAPEVDLAAVMPAATVIYLEAPGVAELLEAGLDHPFVRALLDAGLADLMRAEHGASPAELLAGLDATLGMPVLPTLAELTAGGAAMGIGYDGDQTTALLALRGDDPRRSREVLDRTLEYVASYYGVSGAFREPHGRIRGAPIWRLGDDLTIALRGATLFVSKEEALLDESLALARSGGRSTYLEHAAGRSDANLLFAWTDLGRIEELARGGSPRQREKFERLRGIVGRPEVQLLLGPGIAAAGTAEVVCAALRLEPEDVALDVFARGIDAGQATALLPPDEESRDGTGALRWGPGEGELLELCAYRDLETIFRERLQLFAPEVLPGFAEAISNLTLFAGGLDLEEEVLPGLSPWVRIVVRPVAFSAKADPEIPLPAAAAIIELEDPSLGPVLVGAFQTAVGIINVERAQQAQDGLVLSLSLVGEVQVTSARFHPPREGDGVDLRYNLEPACALVGNAFVLGTHASLVGDLVASGPAGGPADYKAGRAPQSSETLHVDGPAVAAVLEDNLGALVAQKVLTEGVTREEAEEELNGLIWLLRLVGELDVEVRSEADSEVALSARVHLNAGVR